MWGFVLETKRSNDELCLLLIGRLIPLIIPSDSTVGAIRTARLGSGLAEIIRNVVTGRFNYKLDLVNLPSHWKCFR